MPRVSSILGFPDENSTDSVGPAEDDDGEEDEEGTLVRSVLDAGVSVKPTGSSPEVAVEVEVEVEPVDMVIGCGVKKSN